MFEITASDIDIGGTGARGYIWYRIHGAKKPDITLPTFTYDEMNVLIQTIMLERQRQYLFENRNLDFSYTVFHADQMYRFRADAYFDLDQLALNMRAINATVRPYKNLELHPNVTKIVSLVHTKEGLILVTGITGSGKSSTLDSILDLTTIRPMRTVSSSPLQSSSCTNRTAASSGTGKWAATSFHLKKEPCSRCGRIRTLSSSASLGTRILF